METSEFSFKAGKYKRFKIALVKIPGQKKNKKTKSCEKKNK